MPKPVEAKARAELNKLQADVADVRRSDGRAQLHRLAGRRAVEEAQQGAQGSASWREEVLDADHFGLEKVKERILEYLAVQQRVNKMKGPILCLVGPPGVGKTSLGQSIAQGDQSQVRAHVARRRARRSRNSRPSPHVHRFDARPHHPEPEQGRHEESAVRARRDRQDVDGFPRRSRRRRCSKCSIRSRTIRSTITISRSISTCPR